MRTNLPRLTLATLAAGLLVTFATLAYAAKPDKLASAKMKSLDPGISVAGSATPPNKFILKVKAKPKVPLGVSVLFSCAVSPTKGVNGDFSFERKGGFRKVIKPVGKNPTSCSMRATINSNREPKPGGKQREVLLRAKLFHKR